jgi:carbon monoxide dehydrogenase subunit G
MAHNMDMTGERRIPAPRDRVWQALNDPLVLKAAIPGCESLEKLSDAEMTATVSVKIGPIAARFTGRVNLSDIDPPNGYRIAGEGHGGVAGFAKGGATVTLQADGDDTLLKYEVTAQVGGKIAQLGARLIDASARQMADAFFDRFAALVAAPPAEAESAEALAMAAGPAVIRLFDMIPRAPYGYPLIGWISGVLCVAILILLFGSSL